MPQVHVHACVKEISGQEGVILAKVSWVRGCQGGEVRQIHLYNHRLRAAMGAVLCNQSSVLPW